MHATARAWMRQLLLAGLVLLLAGCKTAVLSRLSETEANDVLYTLLQGGIDAEKRADADAGFSVWADKGDLTRALGLLKANAMPEPKHASLGDLFGRTQLITTPAEERVRFVFGTEQALAQTLSKIDGVLVARVHIVLPANDPLATEMKPSSASVFIKHRAGEDLGPAVPAIKDLVVRGIEGLSVDRVAVTLFPSAGVRPTVAAADVPALAGASFLGLSVPSGAGGGLWWRFVLVALAAGAVGWLLRSRPAAPRPRSAPSSAFRPSMAPRGAGVPHE